MSSCSCVAGGRADEALVPAGDHAAGAERDRERRRRRSWCRTPCRPRCARRRSRRTRCRRSAAGGPCRGQLGDDQLGRDARRGRDRRAPGTVVAGTSVMSATVSPSTDVGVVAGRVGAGVVVAPARRERRRGRSSTASGARARRRIGATLPARGPPPTVRSGVFSSHAASASPSGVDGGAVGERPQLLGHAAVVAGGPQVAEQGVQPEVDALDEHERPGHRGVLGDRAGAVERVAHDAAGVLGRPRHRAVGGDGLVEVREVGAGLVGRHRRARAAAARRPRRCAGTAAASWSTAAAWTIEANTLISASLK